MLTKGRAKRLLNYNKNHGTKSFINMFLMNIWRGIGSKGVIFYAKNENKILIKNRLKRKIKL
jgi:hypothetical protein